MSSATAERPKSKKAAGSENLASELEDARAELAVMQRFLDKIQHFSEVVSDAKDLLKKLQAEEAGLKETLSRCRDDIKSVKELISGSNDGIIKLIEPGPMAFMPLFDQMEKADPKTHGKNAAKWREEPVSVLRLSPTATELLYAAEILFIGQLQDRILEDPQEWWKSVAGLTLSIAAAIADKLSDFASKGGAQ